MDYKRVVITRSGGPEVLEIVREAIPQPKPGEVRLKVLAAGVARADVMMRRGVYPGSTPPYPYTPGYDVVGVVDERGKEATRFVQGTTVAALTEVGGYSEYICLAEEALVPVPADLDPAEAVCLVLNGLTAYQMLHRFARVQRGESVLVHSGASGVGTLQIQLGRLVGLRVFATASRRKHGIIYDLGATPIDYRQEDFVKRVRSLNLGGMDAVFDPVGGSHLWRSYRALRRGGRLIAYGEMAVTASPRPAWSEVYLHHHLPRWLNYLPGGRTVQWYEVFVENQAHPDWYQEDLKTLFDLLKQGKIKPVIAERLPLEEAAYAHRLIEDAAVSGKIVIIL